MEGNPDVEEAPASVEERLELYVRRLLEKLSGQYSSEEIQTEVTTLNELVDDFRRRDQLLEKLLDVVTPDTEARQIVERLRDVAPRVLENHEDLVRLHSKSHKLIERSVLLIARGHRQIHQTISRQRRYAPEICGFCTGFGGSGDRLCPACLGRRSVLVYQPALACPRCKGTGKPDESDLSVRYYEICVVCLGSGWAFRIAEQEDKKLKIEN